MASDRGIPDACVRRALGTGALGAAALALLTLPDAAGAAPRVPKHFFGVNFHRIDEISGAKRDLQLRSMRRAGIRAVRIPTRWRQIEPEPPRGDQHNYRFDELDQKIGAIARFGIRTQAMFAYGPAWASETDAPLVCGAGKATSRAPLALDTYAAAGAALARRYGRGGSFWREHPKLPERPITVYEIWNSPNISGTWCPAPDPAAYAEMLVRTAERIESVDERAEIVIGGLGRVNGSSPSALGPGEFMRQVLASPRGPAVLGHTDAVGIHAYPPSALGEQIPEVVEFRQSLRAAGIPDRIPMQINEIGWTTRGAGAISEEQRRRSYRNIARKLPRTDCNISGVLPHTWTTKELTRRDREQWFGLSRPQTARLHPSGAAYADAVQLFRGKADRLAPRRTLRACGGPLPDLDGDGAADELDLFPLNPKRIGPPNCKRRVAKLARRLENVRRKRRRARRGLPETTARVRRLNRRERRVGRTHRRVRRVCTRNGLL